MQNFDFLKILALLYLTGASMVACASEFTDTPTLTPVAASDLQKIYWTDMGDRWEHDGPGTIQRSNLDGSEAEYLIYGLGNPNGIALDLSAGKIYWTEMNLRKTQRANLGGSGVEDLITSGLVGPTGIALDLSAGKIYWTDAGTEKSSALIWTAQKLKI